MKSPFLRRFGMPSPFFDNETGFSPSVLFALAEPGVWYDPSDVANLNWRRNLLTFSEQFDNAAWIKASVTVSANAAAAPDGTITADKVIATNTASTTRAAYQNFTAPSTTTYTFSAYVKAAEYGRFALQEIGSGRFGATFDLSAQTTASLGGAGFVSSSITSVGGGWFRCAVVWNGVASVGYAITAIGYPAGATVTAAGTSYAGDGTSGILIWGAQLEVGSVATEYQRITDVNTEVIERFPTATLFQDTAGTTPVTTPGQTVALALDKSQGLVLGPELVTNGDFSVDANWSKETGWSIAGGAANKVAGAAGSLYQAAASMVQGRTYQITFTVSGYSAGTLTPFCRGTAGTGVSANGTYTQRLVAGADSVYAINFFAGATFAGSIDNISVRELPGNHATQSILASRPTYGVVPLGGRRNLLTFTEQFDNAAWTKGGVSVTVNNALAPDGTLTADLLTGTGATPRVFQTVTPLTSGISYTASCYVKPGTTTSIGFDVINIQAGPVFTFSTKTWSALSGQITAAGFDELADGWFRLRVTFTANTTNFGPGWYVSGLTTSLIWGSQLETGSTATNYQRVGSQFDVTEAGVPSLSYLSFDGIDDFLVTPTITPGTDKAQVFAGVRKLSDALGVLYGHGPNTNSTAGSFEVLSSGWNVTASRYGAGFNISTLLRADSPANFAPPRSDVLNWAFDVSGSTVPDEIKLRVNGTPQTLSTADPTQSGNFTPQIGYIGRRDGTTLPFNGQLYSLIVRFGANLDANTITNTETWVNSRTGAY